MALQRRRCRGFTLIEMLVVLAILGILAAVGVTMLGNRPAGSVRTVLDELEGTLSSAHKLAIATGRDVLVATQGDWGGATPMLLAYGDASLPAATIIANGQTLPESFRVALNAAGALQREHMHAGVVTDATAGWWATAGAGNVDITTVPPFNSATSGFQNVLTTPSMDLFRGGANSGTARISGTNKRFNTAFWIEVVSIRDGNPIPGGPMGVLVVQANGASIYKFYNPGIRSGGDGTWRRI